MTDLGSHGYLNDSGWPRIHETGQSRPGSVLEERSPELYLKGRIGLDMVSGETTGSLVGKGDAVPPRVKCKDAHMAKRKLRAAVGQGIQEVLPERHQLVLIPPLTETDIFQGCISEDGDIYEDARNSIKCENWVLHSFPSTLYLILSVSDGQTVFSPPSFS